MQNEERIEQLSSEDYQKIFGVKQATFEKMLDILTNEYKQNHLKGGRSGKLSVLDRLIIMLSYYREYRVMENMAFDYGVSKSTICQNIQWVENTLIKSGQFDLPAKKKLLEGEPIKTVLLDATECEIERPQKNKRNTTQGRKRNTL